METTTALSNEVPSLLHGRSKVRQSGKRMRTPDILEVHELVALFDQLSHRDRVMALLDTVTGLRRSELIVLKWLDVNFEDLELSVMRSV